MPGRQNVARGNESARAVRTAALWPEVAADFYDRTVARIRRIGAASQSLRRDRRCHRKNQSQVSHQRETQQKTGGPRRLQSVYGFDDPEFFAKRVTASGSLWRLMAGRRGTPLETLPGHESYHSRSRHFGVFAR